MDFKVGFIFYYPTPINPNSKNPVDQKTAYQFNNLLVRLNRKYPEIFPYCQYSQYKIIPAYNKENPQQVNFTEICEDDNLMRIKEEVKDLSTIICFGEKGYYVLQKVQEQFNLNLNIIKTKGISYPVSRHMKLNNQLQSKRIRTNFNVLSQFNDIDKQLSKLLNM